MEDDSWYRDILETAGAPASTGSEFAAFQRHVDDARAEFLAALGRRDPLPEFDPPLIPERDQRWLARLRW
jgi:hypothetical protein